MTHEKELETNYAAFVAELPSLIALHEGEYALIRHGKIIELFPTFADAFCEARKRFAKKGSFSIQEVTTRIDYY